MDPTPVLIGGLTGTAVMTTVMVVGRILGETRFDVPLLLGGLLTGDARRARALGMLLHLLMGGVVLAIAYDAILRAVGVHPLGGATVLGLVHGVMVCFLLPVIGRLHPRVAPGGKPDGLPMTPPGIGGMQLGDGTAAGIVIAHTLYGMAYGAFHAAF